MHTPPLPRVGRHSLPRSNVKKNFKNSIFDLPFQLAWVCISRYKQAVRCHLPNTVSSWDYSVVMVIDVTLFREQKDIYITAALGLCHHIRKISHRLETTQKAWTRTETTSHPRISCAYTPPANFCALGMSNTSVSTHLGLSCSYCNISFLSCIACWSTGWREKATSPKMTGIIYTLLHNIYVGVHLILYNNQFFW